MISVVNILRELLVYETPEFYFFEAENMEAASALSEGTNWCIKNPESFDHYRYDYTIFVAISKKSFVDKYALVIPEVIDSRVLDMLEYLSSPDNLEKRKAQLFERKELIKQEIKNRLQNGGGIFLTEEIHKMYMHMTNFWDRLFFENLDFEEAKQRLSEINDFLENHKDEKLNSILKNHEELFSNLTERLKYKILDSMDTFHVSPFYVFNAEEHPFEVIKERVAVGQVYRPTFWDEVNVALNELEFANSDQSINIKGSSVLPEPYHSMFSDFPPYRVFTSIARLMKTIFSVPQEADFIFDIIKEASKEKIISNYDYFIRQTEIQRIVYSSAIEKGPNWFKK